jgi:hypothetical protein
VSLEAVLLEAIGMKEAVGRTDRLVGLGNTALYLGGCGYESTPEHLRSEVNSAQVSEGVGASTETTKIPSQ